MLQPIQMFSTIASKFQPNTKSITPHYNVNFATKPDTFEKTTAPAIAPENVSFTGYKNDGPIRALGNIECPCCGIKMLTNKDFSKISKGLGCSAKQAISTLDNYEEYMHPVEKDCYHLLKEWSNNQPNKDFKTLLNENREPQLKVLQEKQNTILDKVDEISKALSPKEQETIDNVIQTTRKLVSSNDKEIKFKRKTFIKDIQDLSGKISDKEVHKKMLTEAEKMPTSQNDVSAFVVKYSDRDHKEIGERLVKLSVGTIEHIHPQSEGGRDNISNYLLECGGCNHVRSSIPLGDWVDAHPEMIENTQRYIDKVIEVINSGKMGGFEFYPLSVAKTLFHESDGKLNVKVEGLKEPEVA